MAWITSGYIPSPGRMAVIAGTTFTQLVRMKVFLFLGLFALALLALSSFRLSEVLGPETGGINELVLLKNSAYGAHAGVRPVLLRGRHGADHSQGCGGPHPVHHPVQARAAHRLPDGEGAGGAGPDADSHAADGCGHDAGALAPHGYGCGRTDGRPERPLYRRGNGSLTWTGYACRALPGTSRWGWA